MGNIATLAYEFRAGNFERKDAYKFGDPRVFLVQGPSSSLGYQLTIYEALELGVHDQTGKKVGPDELAKRLGIRIQ